MARNVRHVGFELDLVATKGRTLIVVEVKARQRAPSSDREFQMLLPPKKKAALRRGSDRALAIYGQGVTSARIDLAVVYRHPEQSEGTLVLRYFVDLPLS